MPSSAFRKIKHGKGSVILVNDKATFQPDAAAAFGTVGHGKLSAAAILDENPLDDVIGLKD
jgi:hypothetical protein